jgi:hypothetical protein
MEFDYKGFHVEFLDDRDNSAFPVRSIIKKDGVVIHTDFFRHNRDAYIKSTELVDYYMHCNNIPEPSWMLHKTALDDLRLHIAEAKMEPENAVFIDGKLVGYWQPTEWLNTLLRRDS